MYVPQLSDVRGWTPDYLKAAAHHWGESAQSWCDAYDRIRHEVRTPGGSEWRGSGADAAAQRVGADRLKVVEAAGHLRGSAAAARVAATQLAWARAKVLASVAAAESTGYVVDEEYSVRSLEWNASPTVAVLRHAQAAFHAASIRSAVLELAALDEEAADSISSAANVLTELSFGSEGSTESPVLFVGFLDGPLPEKPSWTPPPGEPPGGWSNDPITRAAQRIAYGHAGTKHLGEWPPGTTHDQLAGEIERIMRAGTDPRGGMITGRTADGAPSVYDPKTNTLVIRDPSAADAGTVYKPTAGEQYVVTRKMPLRVPSLPPGELADTPMRPAPELPKIEPPRPAPGPRGGISPVVVPPQIVSLPHGDFGNIPIIDADGVSDVNTPNAGG